MSGEVVLWLVGEQGAMSRKQMSGCLKGIIIPNRSRDLHHKGDRSMRIAMAGWNFCESV